MTEFSADTAPVPSREEKEAFGKEILTAHPTMSPPDFHKQMRAKFGTSLPPAFYSNTRKDLGVKPKSAQAKSGGKMAKKAAKKAAKTRGRGRAKKAAAASTAAAAPKRRGRPRGGPRGIRPDSMKKIEKAVDFLKKNPDGNTLSAIGEKFNLTSPEHRKKAFEMAGLPIPTRGGPRRRAGKVAAAAPMPGNGRRRRRVVPMPTSADDAGSAGRIRAGRVDDSQFLLMTNNGRFIGSYRTQDDAVNAGMEELTRSSRGGYDSLILYQRMFEISR